MNSKLLIWLGVSTVILLATLTIRWQRQKKLQSGKKPDLELKDFITLLGAVLAIVSSVELFYKA